MEMSDEVEYPKRSVVPSIIVERYDPKEVVVVNDETSLGTTAQRNLRKISDAEPDTIIVSTGGGMGSFATYLSPATIVHIANRLLTDAERATITSSRTPRAWNGNDATRAFAMLDEAKAEIARLNKVVLMLETSEANRMAHIAELQAQIDQAGV